MAHRHLCLIHRSDQDKRRALTHVSAPDQDQQRLETRSLPGLARSYPRHFTLITRTARARASYLAALPSTRAIPDRAVFYVVDPSAPFATL